MNGFPVALVSFCENLAQTVTTAGNQNGWRVAQFGRRGFNADVTAGGVSTKINTGGMPGEDGAGATVRISRSGRTLTVRVGADGDLELADEKGTPVPLDRFCELVGEACDSPIKQTAELPTSLKRLCEQIGVAVVSAGNDNGWGITPFGSRGFNADVAIGKTILKLTTEGKPAADGTGAVIKLKRTGFEKKLVSRAGADGLLELGDEEGKTVDNTRLIELIAEGCGLSMRVDQEIPATLSRFYEKIANTVVKAGQDNGWKVQRFGARGFNADVVLGATTVKLTTDAKSGPDGGGATIGFKRSGFERSYVTRAVKGGELELADDKGGAVDLHTFIELLAEACGAPLKDNSDYPAPLVTLCEKMGNTIVNAGNDNGWKVKMFGSRGINCDVASGLLIAKLTTQGTPNPDGTGVTFRIARAGYEKILSVRHGKDGDLELGDDKGGAVSFERLIELLGEATGQPIKAKEVLPTRLLQLLEKVASTVGTAGEDNGWRVKPFGARGFNADLSVGTNVVKVTTEGEPDGDGAGAILRIKRPGLEKTFVSRMAKSGDLELVDEAGAALPLPKLTDILKEISKF